MFPEIVPCRAIDRALDGKPINQQHEQIYFSLYFAMTGLHALHMIIGLGIFLYLTYHAWKGRYTSGILHAPGNRRLVLALRGYCLDLSVSACCIFIDRKK